MGNEFERDNGTRGVKNKKGRIIANLPAKGGVKVPSPSLNLVQDVLPGITATPENSEPSYEALHQKMTQSVATSFQELTASFEEANNDYTKKLEELESEKTSIEDDQYRLWLDLRNKGADTMNGHRPVYLPEKINAENQLDWNEYRECVTCHSSYPCKEYSEAHNTLNKFSPPDAYGPHLAGNAVATFLEHEIEKEARKNLPQTLSNGLVRGTELSPVMARSVPVGTVLRRKHHVNREDLYIRTEFGWVAFADELGWYSEAKEFLVKKRWTNSNFPPDVEDTITVEEFIDN